MKVHSAIVNSLYWRARDKGEWLMSEVEVIELDATGLQCPMPLLKAKRALNAMGAGQRLRILSTDQGSVRDFRVFAEQSGHLLLESDEQAGVYMHLLEKS